MASRKLMWSVLAVTLVACVDETPSGPAARFGSSFDRGGIPRQHTVVVNPNANGEAIAATVQEAIDMVEPGGLVQVKSGTYNERIVINKGLTLEGIGDGSEPVVIAPPGAPTIAVQVATAEPVIIRNLTVHFSGANGIRGDGNVDVTVEGVTARAVNPPLGQGSVIGVFNDAPVSGGRAHLVVRESFIDGGVSAAIASAPPFPQMFGISQRGDLDGLLERNTIRRTGGACITANTRLDFGGEMNTDILENDLDECYPLQRAGALIVQSGTLATVPIFATGAVNIVGNTIRNTYRSCLPTTAIAHIYARARIERNRILDVVQPCAVPQATRNPAAIWIGSLNPITPGVTAIVRFNDIQGNAHAGVRLGPNISAVLDVTCNWWGAANGPSGLGTGSGDAVLKEGAAATPIFTPFATAPIAGTRATDC